MKRSAFNSYVYHVNFWKLGNTEWHCTCHAVCFFLGWTYGILLHKHDPVGGQWWMCWYSKQDIW